MYTSVVQVIADVLLGKLPFMRVHVYNLLSALRGPDGAGVGVQAMKRDFTEPLRAVVYNDTMWNLGTLSERNVPTLESINALSEMILPRRQALDASYPETESNEFRLYHFASHLRDAYGSLARIVSYIENQEDFTRTPLVKKGGAKA